MSLLGLVILVLILCVVVWAINQLAATFGLPDQIRVVILVLLVLLFVLYIVGAISGGIGWGPRLEIR